MSRRVFITGATGFAGRHLVDACGDAGDVVITAPPSSEADLRNAAVARALVARARPDVVFHLAARAHVGQSWEDPLGTFADNVALSAGVLEAVRREAPDAVVVHVGSSEEYGPPPGPEPMTEAMLPRPQNPYAVSKASSTLVATFYADAYGLRVVRARAFNHAGPGQEPLYALASFASQMAAGPGRRRATRSGSSPAAPTRAATTPTCATSCAPTGCWPSTPSRACSTSAPASRAPPASSSRASPRSPASRSCTRSTPPACAPTRSRTSAAPPSASTPPPAGSREIPFEQTLRDTLAWWRTTLDLFRGSGLLAAYVSLSSAAPNCWARTRARSTSRAVKACERMR